MNVLNIIIYVLVALVALYTVLVVDTAIYTFGATFKSYKTIDVIWPAIKTNIILDCDAEITLRIVKSQLEGKTYQFRALPEEAKDISTTIYNSYSKDLKKQINLVYTDAGAIDFMTKYIVSKLSTDVYDHNINLPE